jgi:hypothetical protein
MSGKDAWNLEKSVKDKFPLFSQNVEGFKKEATYAWLYDDIIVHAEEFIASSHSNQPANQSI